MPNDSATQTADADAPAPADGQTPIKHLYLIDGSGYIFRAYHKLPPNMNRKDGTPTNAVYGFTNMLMKLLRDLGEREAIAVIFDASGVSFRNDIYPEYKANRPEMPEDLAPQIPLVREAVRAFNIACIEEQGFEADDLIASYARKAEAEGARVTIVSSDKDLMQLIRPGVDMMDPMDGRIIGPEEVEKKFGVPPDKVVDVQALWGDSVDNVPGVPGIGQKIAAELIQTYGSVEALLQHAEEIKQTKRRENLVEYAEQARISKRLVQLDDAMQLTHSLEDLRAHEPDEATLKAWLEEQDFTSIVARLGIAETSGAPSPTEAKAEYELVQTQERLDAWIAEAFERGLLAVDVETTALDALRAELVGVSMATAPGRACYIPLAHKGEGDGGLDFDGAGQAPQQVPFDAAVAALQPLLSDPGTLKIGQNIKYDRVVLKRYGLDVDPIVVALGLRIAGEKRERVAGRQSDGVLDDTRDGVLEVGVVPPAGEQRRDIDGVSPAALLGKLGAVGHRLRVVQPQDVLGHVEGA